MMDILSETNTPKAVNSQSSTHLFMIKIDYICLFGLQMGISYLWQTV